MEQHLRRRRALDITVLLFALTASALLPLFLGQNRCWDQFNYHYYSGYALLNWRFHYDFAPAQLQSFHNPVFHVPTYLMLRYLPSRATALILGAIQGLNFWLIYKISQELFSRLQGFFRELLCLAIAATAYYGAANISEIGTTLGDNVISILPLTAILLIIRHLLTSKAPDRGDYYRLASAGIISGLAAGLKLTVAVIVVPIAIALTVVAVAYKMRLKLVALVYAGILFGFLASYGFWGLSLFDEYRNPFFPYFNGIFHSKYRAAENFRDMRFLPQKWQQTLFYPFYFARRNNLVSEYTFRDMRLAACYVLVFIVIVFHCRGFLARAGPRISNLEAGEKRCLVFMTLFTVLSYILWQQEFSIYRYAIVLEFLAPAFLSFGILSIVRRRWMFYSLVFLLNSLICRYEIPLNFGREQFVEDYLKVRLPAWDHLGESVVLMAGIEGSAYIIPSFPRSTRFVRVESTFTHPGMNAHLDNKIRSLLAQYSPEKTLVYLHYFEELKTAAPAFGYYRIHVDGDSCAEVVSTLGNAGYLCRTAGKSRR
jgi:hypothetical protein